MITEFIGSDAPDALRKLDGKITVRPEYVYEKKEPAVSEDESKQGKKVLVFYTSVSFLAQNGHRAIEKINDAIDIFTDNSKRLKIIWISQLIKENAGKLEKDVADDFREAVSKFEKAGLGEYIEDIPRTENERYAKMCDAYYGDPSYLALECFYEHKPVMIADASVLCG